MKTQFFNLLESLRHSFWFLPVSINLATIIIFIILQSVPADSLVILSPNLPWFYANDVAGARSVLSTIAGSMISVTGVVFSITIVALTLASSQFGTRLLRNFMHSTVTKLVLGSLSGTFVFCILVQTSISTEIDDFKALTFSINLALAMTLVSLFMLIYFIHHVATSIQADRLIATTFDELDATIDRLFPHNIDQDSTFNPQHQSTWNEDDAVELVSECSGHLQAIDHSRLIQLASDAKITIKFCYAPGDYLIKGSKLALLWSDAKLPDDLAQKIHQRIIVGPERTPEQDVAYSIMQLVEIAVRALSPGINDPFTAITCIKNLSAALCKLSARSLPSGCEYDDSNQLRLILETTTFTDLLDICFDPIWQYGRQDVIVVEELIYALKAVSHVAVHHDHLDALKVMAKRITLAAKEANSTQYDTDRIDRCYQAFLQGAEAT